MIFSDTQPSHNYWIYLFSYSLSLYNNDLFIVFISLPKLKHQACLLPQSLVLNITQEEELGLVQIYKE